MPAISSRYFRISLTKTTPTIIITIFLTTEEITTTHMPHVPEVLKKELPTILRSTCFNEENIPFHKEVRSTELGHLFEHMLLEYLCIAKIAVGEREAMFSGITKWDWNKDPYGTFHIELSIEKADMVFLSPALRKTSQLFEKILLYPHASRITKEKHPDFTEMFS